MTPEEELLAYRMREEAEKALSARMKGYQAAMGLVLLVAGLFGWHWKDVITDSKAEATAARVAADSAAFLASKNADAARRADDAVRSARIMVDSANGRLIAALDHTIAQYASEMKQSSVHASSLLRMGDSLSILTAAAQSRLRMEEDSLAKHDAELQAQLAVDRHAIDGNRRFLSTMQEKLYSVVPLIAKQNNYVDVPGLGLVLRYESSERFHKRYVKGVRVFVPDPSAPDGRRCVMSVHEMHADDAPTSFVAAGKQYHLSFNYVLSGKSLSSSNAVFVIRADTAVSADRSISAGEASLALHP